MQSSSRKWRRKPANLPAMPRNQLEHERHVDPSSQGPHPSSQGPQTPPACRRNGIVLPSPQDAVFADFECTRLRRRVDLSGWVAADVDAALRLLRAVGEDATDAKDGRRLEEITLDGCERVATLDWLSSSNGNTFSALASLRLERCQALGPENVAHFPAALVELSLAHCEWADDQCLRALARRCKLLANVSLHHCRRVTDYGVAAFPDASVKPALTRLDISYCTKVTDVGVLALFARASRLRVLLAAGLPLLEGVNLQGLPRTSNSLETLDLSGCSRLSASAISHLVRVYANARLTDLNLSGCAQISDDALVALGRCCPSLLELRLASCPLVSDAGVQRLVEFVPLESEDTADFVENESAATRCVKLRSLELSGCFQLTDVALAAIGRQCADLQVLLLDGVRRLSGVGLRAVVEHCAHLQTLSWSGVLVRSSKSPALADRGDSAVCSDFFSIPRLDRAALSAAASAARLKTLHVGNAKCDVDALCLLLARVGVHLRDLDVTSIATDALCESIGTSCTKLRVLRLSRSRYFSERSFLCVARGCTELRALDLESCEQIRDASVVALSEHCAQLEKLVLANDWQVTDRAIALLGERCPRLLTLNVRHCPEVTLRALQLLALRNSCVEASSDGLTPKHANVMRRLRKHGRKRAAACRITRWLKQRLDERDSTKNSLEQALRHFRRRKRCAVRIQRFFRQFRQQKQQRELVARAKRERDERVASAWRAARDLCVVSRELRAFQRRWLAARRVRALQEAERVRAAREHAAVTIQRVARGFLGRRRAHAARCAAAVELQRRVHAATTIQRVARGHAARKLQVLRARREREMLVFAAMWSHERRECAALQLQRVARGFVGRRRSKARAAEVLTLRELQRLSAARIQRSYRAHLARVQLQRFLFRTATQLQRVFRGHDGRRCGRAIVLQRSYALEPRILILMPRSIFTRWLAVQWKQKRDAALLVAGNMQRCYRGYVGRVRFRATRALARQMWFTTDKSARAIQHFFRSIVILKRLARFQAHLRLRRRSATKIQATWRMWTAKVLALALVLRADRKRQHEALMELLMTNGDERHHRDARVKRYFLQFGAACAIAKAYRASLLARGWQSPSQVRFLNASATRIQALVRGHFGRWYARWYRETLVSATRVVQRVWRGKVGRKIWRQLVTERAQRLREQEEEDRAARVSRKLSSQYALDAYERDAQHARVLQSWYRTLHGRQVFKQARQARSAALEARATEKLALVLKLSTESVVFQSRVWRDCMEQKEALLEMEEDECAALEKEVAELKVQCRAAHVAGAQAAVDHSVMVARKGDFARAKKRVASATEQVKARVKPFAVQAKKLTKLSARVHVGNKQLQHELRTLDKGVLALHRHLQQVLPYEPLLLQSDVAYLVSLLELPDGRESIVADELASDAAEGVEMMVVITAPDKGDELEARAYVEAQGELKEEIRLRDPNATIDIDVYTVSEPTQYVIGLILDPCRDHAADCCSDRFGEPAYTTAALSAKEKISLLDESGAPLDASVSRLSDRPSRFDPDCYVDASLTPYRLTKRIYADGLVVTKNYTDSGCVGRLRALAPMERVTMPPCWDHNDTVDALASCFGWDGRRKDNCVAVGYMQTAYIAQCFGSFALDNHCGTFLEVHEPGSKLILSQTRLLGEYPSGFRTTTLPLFFRGDRTRTICSGSYELWWVQRTRYNFIVQKTKRFEVVHPACDFDFATNKYKNYHVVNAAAAA